MMPRSHKRWTAHERSLVAQWRQEGWSRPKIANRLQRTILAVDTVIHNYRLGCRRPQPKPIPLEMIMVPRGDQICTMYEKGWRFEGFSTDGLCIMSKTLGAVREPMGEGTVAAPSVEREMERV